MKFKEFLKENAGNFLTDRNEIEAWLLEMKIVIYTIKIDSVVDVDGSVNIAHEKLTRIPVQFGRVAGDFDCSHNELISLAGCPTEVGDSFYCYVNKLTSLEGCPASVGKDFYCDSNKLVTLKGMPSRVNGIVDCSFNKLTSLDECAGDVGEDFICSSNKLTSLEGLPTHIGGSCQCDNNKLTSHVIGLILTGCTGLVANGLWVSIIRKYLDKPDDIFECQAELIENGYEEYAQL